MVTRIRAFKSGIQDRVVKASSANPRLSSLAQTVETALSGVEGDLYQVRNRSPRDTLNYPIKLNNQFAVLLADAEMGENRPTDSMYTVYRDLTASLDALARRLASIEKDNLAQLNELFRSAGLPPLDVPPEP
jgi:hypothetical protein